jgi:hypothetical protein
MDATVRGALVTLSMLVLTAMVGCGAPCDDLEEICDRCEGNDHGDCASDLDHCKFGGMDVGFAAESDEADCCDAILDAWDSRC